MYRTYVKQMYAVYWQSETGVTGNGEHVLDYQLLASWLSYLRRKYPNMEHWGQDKNGQRVDEREMIPRDGSLNYDFYITPLRT